MAEIRGWGKYNRNGINRNLYILVWRHNQILRFTVHLLVILHRQDCKTSLSPFSLHHRNKLSNREECGGWVQESEERSCTAVRWCCGRYFFRLCADTSLGTNDGPFYVLAYKWEQPTQALCPCVMPPDTYSTDWPGLRVYHIHPQTSTFLWREKCNTPVFRHMAACFFHFA